MAPTTKHPAVAMPISDTESDSTSEGEEDEDEGEEARFEQELKDGNQFAKAVREAYADFKQ
jgi:hypothetical protein